MKRIISLLLVLCVLCTSALLLTGCTSSGRLIKIDPTEQERKVVGKIGDFDIYYDELRYITMTYKDQLENIYGEGIWKTEESAAKYKDELAQKVYASITTNYGALALAAKNCITPESDGVKSYCHLRMEELAADLTLILVDYYSTEDVTYTPSDKEVNDEYKSQLKNMYMTDRIVRLLYSVDGCVEQLVLKYIKDGKLLSNDNDIEKYLKDEFCRTLHVFVRNDAGESVDDNRAIAEKVLSELNGGASFNSMVGSKYNDDLLTTTVNGHYFGVGEMNDSYEKAAFALGVDEYSGIVETADGFYIIKRLPIESDYVNTYFEELKSQYHYSVVNVDINNERASLSFILNDYGKALELWSIK